MQAAEKKSFLAQIQEALYGDFEAPNVVSGGTGGLPSWFDVTGLSVATIGAVCAEIVGLRTSNRSEAIVVDRALASGWFGVTLRPKGWKMPPVWDDLAGLYQSRDGGWIRLHTNMPHHRASVLEVLGCPATKKSVRTAVLSWDSPALETAIVGEGGCAARMMSVDAWRQHDHGKVTAHEPLIHWTVEKTARKSKPIGGIAGPLAGVRILDCTRVLAGPVCTRVLAGFGADVLRIDPPGWEESNVVPEVTLGKRMSTLNLKLLEDRATFLKLLQSADVFVHGYRPGALDGLGLTEEVRRAANPALIDVSLNAYGWRGPWADRRGYDSLVQMSTGVAHTGMMLTGKNVPVPLPVQALDHATGYLMAASVVRALRVRSSSGSVASAKLSLARTAAMLIASLGPELPASLRRESPSDVSSVPEATDWGPAHRLRFPARCHAIQPEWGLPARNLHSDPARW